ncbi:hypothetical protein BC936DRAFT_137680 [Jimgerdemannia flammicorona]|uniref:Uncharacterized protein n=1 Tax=Jimgerdemannia flammicorona TaxID=994334 RepID=A0A433DIW1_9FUNG|nr:hypothetical protein BC936DRAFT_137680 [Jimgerdemannia flammicorona]
MCKQNRYHLPQLLRRPRNARINQEAKARSYNPPSLRRLRNPRRIQRNKSKILQPSTVAITFEAPRIHGYWERPISTWSLETWKAHFCPNDPHISNNAIQSSFIEHLERMKDTTVIHQARRARTLLREFTGQSSFFRLFHVCYSRS